LIDEDYPFVTSILRDRDEAAFRELYRRHTPALYLLALRLLGPRAGHAEDVVQDVWVRASGALATFTWGSTLRTWLCGIVVNRCRELTRSGAREQRALAAWAAEPAVAARWTPETLALEQAIATLPDGGREVLVLHDIYGYTHKEIAHLLGIAAGTAKSQLHDARRSVRRALCLGSERGVSADEQRRTF
jgi:RNA polymerase sigma-70 factor (ECF subfamily)